MTRRSRGPSPGTRNAHQRYPTAGAAGPRPRSGLPPQALELVAREVGLWSARIVGDHTGVVCPRPRLVAALLGEEAQLVERRRCARRGGIGLHDLLIHRGGRIRVLPG